MTATIHMICGPIGAGKTTYARALAAKESAIVFSMDDWMQRLFGSDLPAATDMTNIDFAWFAERVDRCEGQIWAIAEPLLAAGIGVVLDFGFIRHARREKARQHAEQLGLTHQLHVLEANLEIRRQRVASRNHEKGQTYAFTATPEMLEFAERLFETPDPDELREAVRVQTSDKGS